MARGDATADILQHASIAGELAKNLWGRTDFEKYDAAWAEARNWTVDYRGGLFSRAGFDFGDVVQWTEGQSLKFFEFQFSPDTSDTYLLIFTHQKVRFGQDNAYVLETAVPITSVANGAANKIVITRNSHGFSNGDWVKLTALVHASLTFLNGRTVQVANVTANTYDIADVITGALITKAAITTSTGNASRIYTVVSPYDHDDLPRVHAYQIRDNLRLTHPDFATRNLIRTTSTSWAFSEEVIGRTVGQVTGLAKVAAAPDDNYSTVYQVTAVDEEGNEGLPDIVIVTDAASPAEDMVTEIDWTAVASAVYYKVYRSRIVNGNSNTNSDGACGFIGTAVGNRFTDNNITPDFSDQPPREYNPFANGRIRYVTVGAGGTGAAYDSTIGWPAGGTGANGFLAMESGGNVIRGVVVLNGGKDYSGTSITIAAAAGETLTATLSPATGNNPHCLTVFQQRAVYGATDNFPLRIFGSQPGLLSNFDVSVGGNDDDAYELDIDADKVSPIRHLLTVRGGMLAFNEIACWLMYGRNNTSFNPNTGASDIQNATGAGFVKPIFIDSSVVYQNAAGQELTMLVYDDTARVFGGQNVALLSNHLFSPANEIVALTYAPVPSKVVYAVQESGQLLSLTLDNANGVYGCTPNWTRGYFRYALAIAEENESRLYVAVEREIQGVRCMFFERQHTRSFPTIDDAFCVDAGLEASKTAPAGRLVPTTLTGAVTFNVSGATPFVIGDIGKVIRCGTGRATISGYTDSNTVTGTWTRDLEELYPETTNPAHFPSGDWWMDSPSSTLRGAWHLIGESVAILADGAVVTGKTVDQYGEVSLTTPASRAALGLGYTCRAKTLPPTVGDATIEGRRKDIVGVALRVFETDGLKFGSRLANLRTIHDRPQRLWSDPSRLRSEMLDEFVVSSMSRDAPMYFVQDSPRPAAILAFTREIDLGDERA